MGDRRPTYGLAVLPAYCAGLTHMRVTSTAVVIDCVHGQTFHLESGLASAAVGVDLVACLAEGLVLHAAACNDANGGGAAGVERLESAAGHEHDDLVASADDSSGGSGGADELAAIAGLPLNIVYERSFGDAA